jgi:hypothetical protein
MSRRRPFPDHLRNLVSTLDRHGYIPDVRPQAGYYEIRWTTANGRHRIVPICRADNPSSVKQALASVRRYSRRDGVR